MCLSNGKDGEGGNPPEVGRGKDNNIPPNRDAETKNGFAFGFTAYPGCTSPDCWRNGLVMVPCRAETGRVYWECTNHECGRQIG